MDADPGMDDRNNQFIFTLPTREDQLPGFYFWNGVKHQLFK
jgi:hypothetical protein